jgi:hypothetical protein
MVPGPAQVIPERNIAEDGRRRSPCGTIAGIDVGTGDPKAPSEVAVECAGPAANL